MDLTVQDRIGRRTKALPVRRLILRLLALLPLQISCVSRGLLDPCQLLNLILQRPDLTLKLHRVQRGIVRAPGRTSDLLQARDQALKLASRLLQLSGVLLNLGADAAAKRPLLSLSSSLQHLGQLPAALDRGRKRPIAVA